VVRAPGLPAPANLNCYISFVIPVILPSDPLEEIDRMTQETVQIVAGALAGPSSWNHLPSRKGKKKQQKTNSDAVQRRHVTAGSR